MSVNVWGAVTDLPESLDLTTKTAGSAAYNGTTTYGDWTIANGANNNKGWTYFKMGGKSATISSSNPCDIYYSANSGVSSQVDSITVSIAAGSLSKSGMSVNSWGVYVYSDKAMTTQIDYVAGGTITKNAATFGFKPSAGKTWGKGYYYKVSWDLANTTSTNGIICVDKITLHSISAAPDPVLQSIAISGTPKTTYEAGEEFDITGLVVTGTYDTKDPEVITEGISWEITPSGALTAGTPSVSVKATVDSKSDTKNYDVTVTEFVQTYANTYTSDASLSTVITGSKVKWEGCKVTDGYAALKIAKAGTANITVPAGTKTVHLHMVAWNNESADVAVKLGSTTLSSIKPTADEGVSGSSTTYTIATEPKTEDSYYFAIDVNADEATTLSLTTATNKRAILFGVNFEADTKPSIEADVEEIEFEQKELSGTVTDSKVISATGKNLTAAIAASMKEGSDAIFSVVANGTPTAAEGEFTVSYSTTEAGEYAGTVVLSSGETSIEIPVSASVVEHIPVLQSIYVQGEPSKKEYTVGDAFETDGLEVWGKYDEGDDQQITENIDWAVTPATFSATTETSVSVVATALEKTSEAFVVNGLTVNEAPQIATYDFTTNLYGHTGVSSNSSTAGDLVVGEVFEETPTKITFTAANNSNKTRFWDANSKHELRLYTGATFVISSNNYNITKVEFTGSDVKFTVDETAVENKKWEGKKKTVSFVASATSKINSITVTYAAAAPSAATPTITPSVAEAEIYWEPITVTLATTTAEAAIHYTTDGTDPTTASALYENPIAVSTTTTIKAIAVKDGLDNSEIATKTFNFGPVYASLEDLAAADISKGTTVKVSFSNVEIKSIFTSSGSKRQGIFFDIQKGGKDIEIYYASVEVPEAWVAKGTVSGTMTCPWTEYNGTWELAPAANSWNWSELTYNAPAVTGLTKVEVEGAPDKTTYVDGEKFKPAGLTIYATIDDVRAEYDGSKGEVIYTVTPETLTEGTTSVSVIATIGTVSSDPYTVNDLTVTAIQESTIADFISNEGGRCYLIGTVSGKSGNNFTLTDASGSIYVYGHTLATGVEAVANDDYIKVIADEYKWYEPKTGDPYHEALNVVVIDKPQVDVTGVSLSEDAIEVKAGKTATLVATITPNNATDKSVTWSIVNDNANGKITVDQDGQVSVAADAVVDATADVQVTTTDGGFTATCTVTVATVPTFNNGIWQKVEATSELNKTNYYIIASDNYDYAMKSYESGNNCSFVSITKDGSMLTYETQPAIFQLEDGKNTNQYAIRDIDSELFLFAAGSGSSNYLKAQESKNDDKASWTITFSDGKVGIQAASSNRNTMSFNNSSNPKIFSCYSALQSNGQLALYKYVEGAYVISFDANGGDQSTVPDAVVINEGKANIPTSVPTHETRGNVFAYWTADAVGEGTHYTAGQENCEFSANTTLYAQWEVKSAHHITYVTSGAAGEVPVDAENYYANDEVTLASASTLSNPGHNFAGWEVSYNDGEKQIISVLDNKFTMPDYDVTATAQWALKTNDKWVLVTDASQLVAGDKYVLACNSNSAVNGDLSGSYFPSVNATFSDDDDKLFITAMSGQLALTLGGETDAWTLTKDASNYLATSNNNLSWSSTETTWKIEITAQKNVNITSGESNPIKFNKDANPTRFKTYSGQTAIQLYRLIADQKVNGDVDASTLPEQANVTVNEGGNLLINAPKTLGDIYVMEGGKVTISGSATLTVSNFVIKSTMGAGQSGQVIGVTEEHFVVKGNAYFDVTLGANGTNTQWHAFAVPFNVDALNGVYDLDDNKLTNEVNYAIMSYHGDVRAEGKYGWAKFRGIMNPGVFYIMATDGYRTTYRMKMDGGFSYAENNISVTYYTGAGQTTDAGWNGIANNQLSYSSVGVNVQVLNPTTYTYEVMTASTYNFTVGTPFFYQADNTTTEITLDAANGSNLNYAPRRVGAAEIKNVAIRLSNAKYTDHLYLSATDEATNEYQIGRDLVKMTMTNTPAVPQIFAEAYGNKLCMVDAPMVNDEATYALNLYAPAAGEYTIGAAQVEGYEIFLTKDGNVIWNLSMSNATIELNKGNNTGYGITIKQSHKVTTDAENAFGDSDKVQKFIFNDNLYIIRNSQVFDAQGKLVK